MPPVKINTSNKYLAPAIALLIAASLVMFDLIDRQQKRINTTKTSVTGPSSTAQNTSAVSPDHKSQIRPPAASSAPTADTTTLITALVREWEDLDEPEQRDIRLAELDALLQTTDLAALVHSLPGDTLDFALGLPVFQAWIKTNPATAFDLLATRSDVSEIRVRTALAAWFEKDSAACAQHLRELPPGTSRETSLALASQFALKTSPADAASWATLLTPGPRQTGLLEQIATTWCAQNPAEAAAWVSSQPDALTRERLYAALAIAHAEKDPEQATAWLLQSVRPGEVRDQAMTNLAVTWAATDPALISSWIERFPEGETRQTALRSLINLWAHRDRPAAQAWIEHLPPGPQHDEAQAHLDSLPVLTSAN